MGLGWVHHTRLGALPNQREGRSTDLQLVELVLSCGQARPKNGGHHEPCAFTRCVGRATQHANQTTIHLTPMHAAKEKLMGLVANVRAALAHVRASADQLLNPDPWRLFFDYVIAKIMLTLQKNPVPSPLKLAG